MNAFLTFDKPFHQKNYTLGKNTTLLATILISLASSFLRQFLHTLPSQPFDYPQQNNKTHTLSSSFPPKKFLFYPLLTTKLTPTPKMM